MNLQTLKNRNSEKGFTIVELLIVIVVIAILAAISIVAYTGIQNRAKTSSAQNVASQVAKKAQAYYALKSNYPASEAEFNAENESKLEGVSISGSAPNATNGTTTVQYVTCGTSPNITGARVHYRDYVNNRVTSPTTDPASLVVGTC